MPPTPRASAFPFVICARRNKKEAILRAFPERLAHTRDEEIATALDQIFQIAALRLATCCHDRTRAGLSTHVLDLVTGRPAAGMTIELWRDGRCVDDRRHQRRRPHRRAAARRGRPARRRIRAPLPRRRLLRRGRPRFLDRVPVRFHVTDAGGALPRPAALHAMGLQHLSRQLMRRCDELGAISDEPRPPDAHVPLAGDGAGQRARRRRGCARPASTCASTPRSTCGAAGRGTGAARRALVARIASRHRARRRPIRRPARRAHGDRRRRAPAGARRALPVRPRGRGVQRRRRRALPDRLPRQRRGGGHAATRRELSPDRSEPALATARRPPREILGYVEVHIEQGPVLEARGLPLGVGQRHRRADAGARRARRAAPATPGRRRWTRARTRSAGPRSSCSRRSAAA